jgi:hypothetical protein
VERNASNGKINRTKLARNREKYTLPLLSNLYKTITHTTQKTSTNKIERGKGISSNAIKESMTTSL